MTSPGFGPELCNGLLNSREFTFENGETWFQAWRRYTPAERQDWVRFAAEHGVVPEGAFDPQFQLPPSMVLVPGAYCFRVLAGSNADEGASTAAGQPGSEFAERETGADISRLPPSGILERLREFFAGLLDAALRAIAGGVDALRDLLRRAAEALAGIFGGGAWLVWAASAAAVLAVVWVAAGDRKAGGRAGRVR